MKLENVDHFVLPVDIEEQIAAETKKKMKMRHRYNSGGMLKSSSDGSSAKNDAGEKDVAEKDASAAATAEDAQNQNQSETGHTIERGFAKYFLPFEKMSGWVDYQLPYWLPTADSPAVV